MSCPPYVACQITSAAAQAVAMLTDSVIVKRKTDAATDPDGAGGFKPVSGDGTETVATIDGLLTSPRRVSRERDIGSQVNAPVPFDVYLEHPTIVRSEDQLIINSRTFEVQGVSKLEAIATLDRAFCVELQK
jgi:hypothetical protein